MRGLRLTLHRLLATICPHVEKQKKAVASHRRGRKTISKEWPGSLVEWAKRRRHVLCAMKNPETSGQKQCWQAKARNGKV
jgi:hypothetical protein